MRRPLSFVLLLLSGCTNDGGLTKYNALPTATIVDPLDGAEILAGTTVTLAGVVGDGDSAAEDLVVSWRVGGAAACAGAAPSAAGESTCEVVMPDDDLEVTLTVTDPAGSTASDTVGLVVVPDLAPTVTIESPAAEGHYYSDQLLTFRGLAADAEDASDTLLVRWESSLSGVIAEGTSPTSSGVVETFAYLEAGEQAVQLFATDSHGNEASASVIVDVGPPNSAPTCTILSPASGGAGAEGSTIPFEATVGDVDVPADWLTVTWESDKDGVLGASTPDSDGSTSFWWADLTAGTHTVTLRAADEVGATCSTSIVYTVGTAPELVIEAPGRGEVVNEGETVEFTALVADVEDPGAALYVTWESDRDGTLHSAYADSTGVASFIVGGLSTGTHALTVTVVDSSGLSAAATSSFVVNGLPTAPTVSISPSAPLTDDVLTANLDAPAADPEGDALTYAYAWTRNGTVASTASTVAAAATSRGETWALSVWANDGYGDGLVGTASVVVGNTAPTLSGVSVSPDPAYRNDTLSCLASGYADADGDADASTYAWTVDGVAAGAGSTLAGPFAVGEEVACTVTPFDGADAGIAVGDAVTIANTPPTAPALGWDPSSPAEGEALQCTIATPSTDDDGDVVSYAFAWLRDGAAYTTLDTLDHPDDTVPAGVTAAGEVWSCTVVPNDGADDGPSASSSVTIGGSGGDCIASGGWSIADSDDDGLPEDCDLAVLLVGGHGWTTDNIETTLLARGWSVDRVEYASLAAVTDFTPYDVVAVAYGANTSALTAALAANAAGDVGLVVHRGGSDAFTTTGLGDSTYYQSADCTVDDPSHFVTEAFATTILDVSYTYKTVVRSVPATGRVLVSCSDASVVLHTTYRRLTTSYYGHDVGMPWGADGELLDLRSYAWAAGFGDQ